MRYLQVAEEKESFTDSVWLAAAVTRIRLSSLFFSASTREAIVNIFPDRTEYLPLFLLLLYTFSHYRTWSGNYRQYMEEPDLSTLSAFTGFIFLCLVFLFFFHIMITHNRLFPQLHFFLHFHSFSVFKVFIHFSFIPHSSMFLIFLPHPLYSRLQHPAMQTQPVLKGSELLKPLLPFPLCRSGPQRKVGGERREE